MGLLDGRWSPPHLHPSVARYVQSASIAEGYDRCFATNQLFQYDCTFLDKYIQEGDRVLDIGCGTGRHLVYLGSRGAIATGLDLSPHMLAEAKANLEANRIAPSLLQADLHCMPFDESARFNGILLMFSTLGMISGAGRRAIFLEQASRLLAKNGVLLLHVHNRLHGASRDFFAQLSRRLGLSSLEPGDAVMRNYRGLQDLYCHFFTDREISEALQGAGFVVVEMQALNHTRTGPYIGPDARHNGNGFLVAARLQNS